MEKDREQVRKEREGESGTRQTERVRNEQKADNSQLLCASFVLFFDTGLQ